VDGAPLNSGETGPDISRADFVFCMTAITWGWGVDETAGRLMEENTKAQMIGKAYVTLQLGPRKVLVGHLRCRLEREIACQKFSI
jgi:hypothetical protein